MSQPQTVSRSVQTFITDHPCAQHTDTETTLHATSVATGRILCGLIICTVTPEDW